MTLLLVVLFSANRSGRFVFFPKMAAVGSSSHRHQIAPARLECQVTGLHCAQCLCETGLFAVRRDEVGNAIAIARHHYIYQYADLAAVPINKVFPRQTSCRV